MCNKHNIGKQTLFWLVSYVTRLVSFYVYWPGFQFYVNRSGSYVQEFATVHRNLTNLLRTGNLANIRRN